MRLILGIYLLIFIFKESIGCFTALKDSVAELSKFNYLSNELFINMVRSAIYNQLIRCFVMDNVNTSGNMATIIGVADATHYLVGLTDCNNNFAGLNGERAGECVHSIVEAKELLKSHDYSVANLEYQSAYDEMCGLEQGGKYQQVISL